MAGVQKVWQYQQRTETVVVRLASDLLSCQRWIPGGVMVHLEQNWGLWDTEGSFVSTWHWFAICPSCQHPPPPPSSTCLLHLNTTDGGVALWAKQVTKIKSQGGSREFQSRRGCYSVSRLQRCARERLNPQFFASSFFFLWCLIFFLGSAWKPESPVSGRSNVARNSKSC